MSRTLRVDDIARHHLARRELLFFVWVTLTERKWVILAERRRVEWDSTPWMTPSPATLVADHGPPPHLTLQRLPTVTALRIFLVSGLPPRRRGPMARRGFPSV